MTDLQTKDYNRGRGGLGVMDDNTLIWNGSSIILAKHDLLLTSLTKIGQLKTIQETDTTGNKQTKLMNKLAMGSQGEVIAKVLTQFAIDTENTVLEKEIDFSLSALTPTKDLTAKTRNQLVHARATDNLAALIAGDYGIDADMLDDYQDAIDDFDSSIPKSKDANAVTKAATLALKKEMVTMLGLLNGIKKLLIRYRSTETDFYNAYLNATSSNDSGNRKLAIEIKWFDKATGVVLPKVKTLLVELGTEKLSSEIGRVPYYSLGGGNYTITGERKGYKKLEHPDVPVTKGVITRLELVLEKES